jgi:hypothetical protein
MTKVYAVNAGSYSDYGICGIFSTRENAEKYMQAFPRKTYSSYNDIEEYELDEYVSEIDRGLLLFWVRMYKDGEVFEVVQREGYGGGPDSPVSWMTHGHWSPKKPWANFYVWAHDKDEAIKIANERRIMDLASNSE